MRSNPDMTDPALQKLPWLGIVKFLLIAFLTVILFLLGQDIVRHASFEVAESTSAAY